MKVFVCGSVNDNIDPKYTEGIDRIARNIANHKDGIVCVGSKYGVIGAMYNEMIQRDGFVDIIVPTPYARESEGMLANSITKVDTLFMLQQIALRNTEVTLILPGGNGTLAELYMITDSIKSGFDTDKVIIYNINGFYNNVKEMNEFMLQAGTLSEDQYKYFTWCNTPEEVIAELTKTRRERLKETE